MSTPIRWSAITVDCTDPQRLGDFWGELLRLEQSEPLPGWLRLGGAEPGTPVLTFQPVPEPKRGKTRIHLDLTVDDMAAAMATVVRLGGRSLDERHDYDEGLVIVMADPEGNEFCLAQYYR